jgi:hypothetical protein
VANNEHSIGVFSDNWNGGNLSAFINMYRGLNDREWRRLADYLLRLMSCRDGDKLPRSKTSYSYVSVHPGEYYGASEQGDVDGSSDGRSEPAENFAER